MTTLLLKRTLQELAGRGNTPSGERAYTPSTTPYQLQSPINPPSSPISPYLTTNLRDFVTYVVKQSPTLAGKLEDAYTTLEEQDITIEQIQATKISGEWSKLGLTIGMGYQLGKHIKAWERSLQKERHVYTPPPQATTLAVRPSPRKQRGGVVYDPNIDTQANITTQASSTQDEEYDTTDLNTINNELYTMTDDELR